MSVAPQFGGDSPDWPGSRLMQRWGWLRTPGTTQTSFEHIRSGGCASRGQPKRKDGHARRSMPGFLF